jgi:uncharacterized protein (UPF0332 family)
LLKIALASSTTAFDERQEGDYMALADFTEEHVRERLSDTSDFLAAVRKLFGEHGND